MLRPCRIARTTVTKLSSSKHDGRCLARHVRAASTHRDSDMGGHQRGGVVDAIASHGHDIARTLERIHQAQFVFRSSPGEHIDYTRPAAPKPARRVRPVHCRALPRTRAARPACSAIARAVSRWSPVSMIRRMPAACASTTASATPERRGSANPTRPSQSKPKVPYRVGQARLRQCPRRRLHEATARTRSPRAPWLDLGQDDSASLRRQPAQVRDGLRSALAGDHEPLASGLRPGVRDRGAIGREGILAKVASPATATRTFSERAANSCRARSIGSCESRLAGQYRGFQKRLLGQGLAVATGSRRWLPGTSLATAIRFSVSVPVLSVHSTVMAPRASIAEARRTRALCWAMRHAPSAKEHGKDDRKLLGEIRHRQGDSRQQSVQPAAARSHIQSGHAAGTTPAQQGKQRNHPPDLALQWRQFGLDAAQLGADPANAGLCADCHDLCRAPAADHQGARMQQSLFHPLLTTPCDGPAPIRR